MSIFASESGATGHVTGLPVSTDKYGAATVSTHVSVRVPATSANLGPGYDCFGLALARYDEVDAALLPSGIDIQVSGVGAGQVPRDDTHLVVRAVARAWRAAGEQLPGLSLNCRNTIPHGGGQGSSAAAIVAGLLAGRALLPDPSALSDDDVLALANEMEGHPDNIAPALLGGFTLAWLDADGTPQAVRQQVHPRVRAVIFGAAQASSTHESRMLLPQTVPHSDAAANAAAAALLVHALTVDPGYLFEATVDRLHQSYRAAAMPESATLLSDLRAAGVPAVISGAGPSVLALTDGRVDLTTFHRAGFTAAELEICADGAQLTRTS